MKRCSSCRSPCLPSQAFCSACGASLLEAAQIVGDPYLGTVLQGRYRIVRKLGEGGMGAVYRAEVLDIGHTVAVKLLHERLVGDEVTLQRFEREAQVASKLNHPNSIGILDFGHTAAGTSFLVMEYLNGISLSDALKTERITVRRAVHIQRQILSVLQAAHALSIIHRDLKPANVFLVARGTERDHVKVLDFGIARLRRDGGARVTRTGMVCGTPEYMSPEQARGLELDARSDLYAAGVVFYEMITGRRPFERKSPAEVMSAQIADPVIPPSERAPERGIPPSLDAIVLWALAKAPEDRFPSAIEFQRVLDSWAQVADPEESGPLELRCPGCGAHVSVAARRCPQCGESLMPDPALSGPGVYEVSSDDIVQDYLPLPVAAAVPTLETRSSPGGLRTATPVSVELGPAPADWWSSPVPSLVPFFGHQALLEELEASLVRPGLQRLRVVGAPGVGKRRIAGTLIGRLASEGRRGVSVQPDPWDVAEPLGAVQRAATQLLELPCEPMHVDDLLDAGRDRGLDDATVYGLADLFNLGKPAGVSLDDRRLRRARAWQTLVSHVAAERPVALLFEDFDRMDGATRELVLALAAQSLEAPVALLLTLRPEYVALWPMGFLEVRPPPLARADLEELALEFSEGGLTDEAVGRVVDACGANPLHLQQLVAFLRAHPGTEPPRGLADMIAVRAGRLPPALHGVLQAAAVLGDAVDEESLQELTGAVGWVREAVEALATRAYFAPGADGTRFVHPYVRQVIYSAVPAGIRAELHTRAAEHLRQRSASPVVLAHHLWHSEASRERALPELIAAGEWALSVLEEEGATLAFRRALKLLPRPRAETQDADLRAAWMRAVFGLVTALARSGDRDEARLLVGSAVEEAASAGWHAEAARLEVTAHI